MFNKPSLVLTTVLALFAKNGLSIGCVPRASGQYIQDTSFETPDNSEWTYGGAFVGSNPTYPARTGNNVIVAKASYIKNSTIDALITRSWIQQFVYSARTGWTSNIKLSYRVLSNTKGASCPSPSTLPQTSCKLRVSYVDQTIFSTTNLKPSSTYIDINAQFVPESSARYFNVYVECPAPSSSSSPNGCADITVLIDDVTWTDPGHECWTPLGCYTDRTSARALPAHGRLPNWPYTTTIESCQEACGRQGYVLAGLEFGKECFCGNEIGGGSVKTANAECNMACSGDGRQLCGAGDRVDVYRKP